MHRNTMSRDLDHSPQSNGETRMLGIRLSDSVRNVDIRHRTKMIVIISKFMLCACDIKDDPKY